MKKPTDEAMLGTFEVTGDKLCVTDPCYERTVWCAGVVGNVVPGTWQGVARYSDEGAYGKRVCQVEARHVKSSPSYGDRWSQQSFEVGVDSGQAGIFDERRYPQGECGDYGDTSTFYGRACEATLGRGEEDPNDAHRSGNVIDEGVVVSSGYGDGSYLCETLNGADDKVVAVRVTFIDDELNDEGDCEEDYESEDEMDE